MQVHVKESGLARFQVNIWNERLSKLSSTWFALMDMTIIMLLQYIKEVAANLMKNTGQVSAGREVWERGFRAPCNVM